MINFIAIDFETANRERNSACAIGIVKVSNSKIVRQVTRKIKPPRNSFEFTHIHGITWDDVKNEERFDSVWKEVRSYIEPSDLILAHNAPFDRGVLEACCSHYELPAPSNKFICTVKVARSAWNIYPTKLPNVCDELGIELDHHDAGSDALACARIGIAASKMGFDLARAQVGAISDGYSPPDSNYERLNASSQRPRADASARNSTASAPTILSCRGCGSKVRVDLRKLSIARCPRCSTRLSK